MLDDDIKLEYQSPNLIAYYPFDGDATEKTGTGKNGIAHQNVSYVDGKKGHEEASRFFKGDLIWNMENM